MKNLPDIEFSETVHDYSTMLEAVKLNGIALGYASDELKDNETIVSHAMKTNCWAFMHASSRLKRDKVLVIQAIEKNGEMLFYCPEFADDLDVAFKAIQENGANLQHVSDNLKNNKILVLKALEDNMFALKHISDNLLNNKEIAIFCLRKDEKYLIKFSEEIQEIFKQGGINKLYCGLLDEKLKEYPGKAKCKKIKI